MPTYFHLLRLDRYSKTFTALTFLTCSQIWSKKPSYTLALLKELMPIIEMTYVVMQEHIINILKPLCFLATLVALHFTPVSEPLGHSFQSEIAIYFPLPQSHFHSMQTYFHPLRQDIYSETFTAFHLQSEMVQDAQLYT